MTQPVCIHVYIFTKPDFKNICWHHVLGTGTCVQDPMLLPLFFSSFFLRYVPGKKFGNFLAQNLILPGTFAIYRIVNIWNDQQMSLISHFRSFNLSFQKCRLKIANREWKMFHGELSAAANKYWCVFSGRIIYTEKE
jgi:hypothetical protein